MLIIGERINASRKGIARAIEARDRAFIQNEVQIQEEAGADYIDVNAALFVDREADYLKWAVEVVQEATERPLCIDSPDPEAIREVLPGVDKSPMINSITLESSRLERLLPVVRKYGATVIGLCQSETVIAKSLEEKRDLAGELVDKVTEAGIPLEALYIDPLIFPVAAETSSAAFTLEAISTIMTSFPGVHTICGLTNVSHGLPQRKLVNRTFLVAAVSRGLDAVIMDPTDRALYAALKTSVMLAGEDDFCMEYIRAHREGRLA